MAQTNVYNGLDTRVGSTTNSVANTYLRNGSYVTAPVIKDSNATFTPGVSEPRGTTTTFSHSGLKNVDAQTSVSQTVNATQQYDAFGNLASSTGTWQGQFGYGGGFGYQQDASGLKLLGHRYYDASTGRFLTRDPINDGRNWIDSKSLGMRQIGTLFKRMFIGQNPHFRPALLRVNSDSGSVFATVSSFAESDLRLSIFQKNLLWFSGRTIVYFSECSSESLSLKWVDDDTLECEHGCKEAVPLAEFEHRFRLTKSGFIFDVSGF